MPPFIIFALTVKIKTMKRLLTIIMILFSCSAFAQKYEYCELKFPIGGNVRITVNYRTNSGHDTDADNDTLLKMRNIEDALWYMGCKGWEYVNCYTYHAGKMIPMHYFLLRREIK